MTDKRHSGCTTSPDRADVLSQRIDIDDPMYEDVVGVVEEIVALHVNMDKTLGLKRETFTAQAARIDRC